MAARLCSYDGGKPEDICPISGGGKLLPYWCEGCQMAVAEKRCPLCGLKTKKIRLSGSDVGRRS